VKATKTLALLAVCCLIIPGQLALGGTTWRDWMSQEEPPGAPAVRSTDGSPAGGSEYEIYSILIKEEVDTSDVKYNPTANTGGGTGKFKFEIYTNHEPYSARSDYGYDSYDPAFGGKGVAAGDLYIRVRGRVLHQDVALFGFGIEEAFVTGDGYADYAKVLVEDIYEGARTPLITKVGKLYKDPVFFTGTYENYGQAFAGVALPDMVSRAKVLPGLAPEQDAANDVDRSYPIAGGQPNIALFNYYPNIMLAGTYESSAATPTWLSHTPSEWDSVHNKWLDPWAYVISGEFTLPSGDYNDDDHYIEVWNSMLCGNDAARTWTIDVAIPASEIPLPGSLVLCAIGIGLAGAVQGIRRLCRRS
jgi:hypothetical protein